MKVRCCLECLGSFYRIIFYGIYVRRLVLALSSGSLSHSASKRWSEQSGNEGDVQELCGDAGQHSFRP